MDDPSINPEHRFALQSCDPSDRLFETYKTFARRGEALEARDVALAREPDHARYKATRAIDIETGTIIEWQEDDRVAR